MKIKAFLIVGFFSITSFLFTSPITKTHVPKFNAAIKTINYKDSLTSILDSIDKIKNDSVSVYVKEIKNTSKSIAHKQKELQKTFLHVDSFCHRYSSLDSNLVLK